MSVFRFLLSPTFADQLTWALEHIAEDSSVSLCDFVRFSANTAPARATLKFAGRPGSPGARYRKLTVRGVTEVDSEAQVYLIQC